VAAMRELWATDVSSFRGEFTHFAGVRVCPKPVRGRRIPVVVGGNSDAALRRVASFGDGWYGFNLAADAALNRISRLTELCRQRGRDPAGLSVAVAVAGCTPDQVPALAAAGVTELVLLGAPPDTPGAAARWVAELAAGWGLRGPG
jgi:alkanesulfonate monooxygenase SsuD/methylene tetrahydromethanopterin reductase-like flavin-dependent oxidoreductase (luciferase family)